MIILVGADTWVLDTSSRHPRAYSIADIYGKITHTETYTGPAYTYLVSVNIPGLSACECKGYVCGVKELLGRANALVVMLPVMLAAQWKYDALLRLRLPTEAEQDPADKHVHASVIVGVYAHVYMHVDGLLDPSSESPSAVVMVRSGLGDRFIPSPYARSGNGVDGGCETCRDLQKHQVAVSQEPLGAYA